MHSQTRPDSRAASVNAAHDSQFGKGDIDTVPEWHLIAATNKSLKWRFKAAGENFLQYKVWVRQMILL